MRRKFIILYLLGVLGIIGLSSNLTNKRTDFQYLSVDQPVSTKNPPQISMVATFPGEIRDLRETDIDETYNTLKKAGVGISTIYFTWGDLEGTKGKYNWDEIDYNIKKISDYKMKTSLVLKIIDTNQIGKIPGDLTFTSFDDPLLKERFAKFIIDLLDRHKGKIHYLWLGNEIDDYLYINRNQVDNFKKFFEETSLAVKKKHPEARIGTISTYHDAKNNSALDIIQKVGEKADLIGFTLYPEMIRKPGSGNLARCFDEIAKIAGKMGKEFAITESGWSSRGIKGSKEEQARFIREAFAGFEKHKESMDYLGLFILYDLPASVNKAVALNYGLAGNREFLEWQGSLGLADNNGKAKISWQALLDEINKYSR